jgi:hypothetical protein
LSAFIGLLPSGREDGQVAQPPWQSEQWSSQDDQTDPIIFPESLEHALDLPGVVDLEPVADGRELPRFHTPLLDG